MKHFYSQIKKFLNIALFLGIFLQSYIGNSQTLTAGDIIFTGYDSSLNSSDIDSFSFVTLVALPAGTVIYFTDRGYFEDSSWRAVGAAEGSISWTVGASIPVGKEIIIKGNVASVYDPVTLTSTANGTIAITEGTMPLTTGLSLSNVGDQIIAFQGGSGLVASGGVTIISGLHYYYCPTGGGSTQATWDNAACANGANGSIMPPGLVGGTSAFFPNAGTSTTYISAKFNSNTSLLNTVANIRTAVMNPANWTLSQAALPLPSGAPFLGSPPAVTTTAATGVKSVSALFAGNVTDTGGDANVERGIVWATTTNPTTGNNKVQIGTGVGNFSGTVTGLTPATTIYYKAYAKNTTATSYGSELTLTTGAALSTSSTSQTNVSCNGGSNGTATVTASGGTTPYIYSWSPSGGTGATASGLGAGPYTVTITDGELTQITRSFTIIQPSILNGTPSTTAVSCFGGSNGTATITPFGGTPGYTYLWSNGATTATASGLIAGTYSVTITDANSCTRTISNIIVGQPSSVVSGTPSTTSVSCFGGSNGTATVIPSGGTPGYTYLWSNGATTATATGLTAGTYSVTITDSKSCTAVITNIIVGTPASSISGTSSTTPVSCFGGSNGTATILANGGTGTYTYSWSPSGGTAATATGLAAGTYSVTITDSNACTGTINNIVVGSPASAINGTPSTTPVSCNGGSNGTATVLANGGTGTYTYLWSNGATTATASGLSAGTYTVIITDSNSCTRTINNIIVGQAPAISANATQTNVSCNGGSNGTATVTPSGGTGTYTYLWSNGATTSSITGLSQGNYSVTITDANLCPITQNFTISQPPVLTAAQGTINNVSCNGGSNGTATVNVTGGTGTYTYSWAPAGGTAATATGLAAGTYIVTVRDANLCQTTQSFTIIQPPVLAATKSQTDVLCNGAATGSATVDVTGGTGTYTYSWAPAGGTAATATGLTAGTYTVTVRDANLCQITETFTIIQPSALTATPSAQTNIGCRGDATGSATVNVTGGTGTYTYSWAPSGGTAATASGLTAGTYTVTVKDANLCQTTQSFTITQPAAILSATTAATGVSCFGGSNGSASVTASGGTPGYTYLWAPLGGTSSTISGRPAGNYTCTITDANGCTLVKNVTISTPAAFSATAAKTDVSCNGGSNGTATITASGGTFPYTYSWSPSGGTAATATGLTAGNYTVTIQDANTCIYTVNVTIDQPNALSVTPSQTNVLCNGGTNGTATVTVSGGTPNYTYVWFPSGGTAATATGLTAGNYSVLITDAKGCSFTQNFTITQPPVLSATQSQINATCSTGGQAAVSPSGGTTPYTYLWSPNGATTQIVTGLTQGNHSVVITDGNGCTITKNFTITTTNTLVATTSQTNVLCNGANTGSASVVPSGAPGPFTYVWAPFGGSADTASNLTAGSYSVTITSGNGCSIVKNFTIIEPTAITITPSQTNIACNGASTGSASVSVTGGTGAYTYAWSPSGGTAATATGLAAGTYTVTVTDGNLCTKTQSFTITEPNAITATTSQTNVSCNGGSNASATVNVTGGTGAYSYVWSPAGGTAATASGLVAGTYTVTVTDANLCQTTATVTITEPSVLSAATSKTDVSCNGANNGTATVNVTGGTGTYNYLWAPSGGTAATATGLAPGTYTVTVQDANSCQTTASVTIAEPAILTAAASQINISCNGANNGSASVIAAGGNGNYTYSWAPSGGSAATASNLAPGTYTVTITDANLCAITESFTITEPAALIAATSQVNVSCNGGSNGSATVNVTGGSGSYSYVWSPSGGTAATATGLAAGIYTVTVTDANLCELTQSFSITEPAVLSAVTAKTDVSCIGSNDGTASVTVSGGTGNYTYSWSPSGGTAATASGLSPNTYTVTITDDNGCSLTETINIITTPDLTAPVPTVATLPEITNYCSILPSEIAIPTATDNCVGTINGTTTDPLTYNTAGTYVITWKYDDGNGNVTTQLQTLNVITSPINAVTFSDAEFTYDGNAHPIQVANLPSGANVTYSANNGSTNAGTYVITATVTPSASNTNCSPIVLTANLVIKKAAQQITFSAIPVKTLGLNNTFNLTATSSSNLPVSYTYTYDAALPPATVSATGVVNMLRSGEVLITAHQTGDNNYLAAADVSQLLVILNDNVDVKRITLGNQVFENPGKVINYVLPCGETNPNVSIFNESNATITPAANFTIQTPKPGIYNQNVTITSEDGSLSETYSITVEKPFGFYDIVHQKFNNVLLVNNNPQTNGGYEFTAYQWFKNGVLVGTGQYYSSGNDMNSPLDPSAVYSVKMTTKDGKVLQTCQTQITLTNTLTAKLYPNPIETGKVITVEADFPKEELEKMQISLYTVTGQLVKTVKSSTAITEIQLPPTTESNMYLVVLETPNVKKSFKVIVK